MGSKSKVSLYVIAGVVVFIVMIAVGFGLGSMFNGSDSEPQAEDNSNVGSAEDEPEEDEALSLDDHEGLVNENSGRPVEGDFSGDPTDLYLIVTAPEGSRYSVTTYSTDENGQRIEKEFRNLTDTTTVLKPEDTGLHIADGVLLIDSPEASSDCDRMFSVDQATVPSDPGCSYGASYRRTGQNFEDDRIVLLTVDGTGKILEKDDFTERSKTLFVKNENGEVVRRND